MSCFGVQERGGREIVIRSLCLGLHWLYCIPKSSKLQVVDKNLTQKSRKPNVLHPFHIFSWILHHCGSTLIQTGAAVWPAVPGERWDVKMGLSEPAAALRQAAAEQFAAGRRGPGYRLLRAACTLEALARLHAPVCPTALAPACLAFVEQLRQVSPLPPAAVSLCLPAGPLAVPLPAECLWAALLHLIRGVLLAGTGGLALSVRPQGRGAALFLRWQPLHKNAPADPLPRGAAFWQLTARAGDGRAFFGLGAANCAGLWLPCAQAPGRCPALPGGPYGMATALLYPCCILDV